MLTCFVSILFLISLLFHFFPLLCNIFLPIFPSFQRIHFFICIVASELTFLLLLFAPSSSVFSFRGCSTHTRCKWAVRERRPLITRPENGRLTRRQRVLSVYIYINIYWIGVSVIKWVYPSSPNASIEKKERERGKKSRFFSLTGQQHIFHFFFPPPPPPPVDIHRCHRKLHKVGEIFSSRCNQWQDQNGETFLFVLFVGCRMRRIFQFIDLNM